MQCECNVNGMPAMPEMSEMFEMPKAQVVEECRSSKDRRLESRQEQCAQCATYHDVSGRTTTYQDVSGRTTTYHDVSPRIRRMQPRLTVCFNFFFSSAVRAMARPCPCFLVGEFDEFDEDGGHLCRG